MMPETRFLAGVALFILLPATARGEVVTLLCQMQQGGGSFTLSVDYDKKTVSEVNANGSLKNTSPATITQNNISWDQTFENVELFKGRFGRFRFAGQINRLSGAANVTYERVDTSQPAWTVTGLCGRAAQKF